jgi:hypothetical protein
MTYRSFTDIDPQVHPVNEHLEQVTLPQRLHFFA